MKPSNIILTYCMITAILILGISCQKDDPIVTYQPCTTCPPPLPTHSVNLSVSNWTTSGDGFFRSDFAASLKDAAGEYNSIVNAYLVTTNSDIQIDYSTPLDGGSISRNGTLLVFKSGTHNQIPFSSLEIRVVVN
jgi:hypothetical protein